MAAAAAVVVAAQYSHPLEGHTGPSSSSLHTHMHKYTYTYIFMYIYVCIEAHTHVCMCVYRNVYVHACVHGEAGVRWLLLWMWCSKSGRRVWRNSRCRVVCFACVWDSLSCCVCLVVHVCVYVVKNVCSSACICV